MIILQQIPQQLKAKNNKLLINKLENKRTKRIIVGAVLISWYGVGLPSGYHNMMISQHIFVFVVCLKA